MNWSNVRHAENTASSTGPNQPEKKLSLSNLTSIVYTYVSIVDYTALV
jgi:hypothetical protein